MSNVSRETTVTGLGWPAMSATSPEQVGWEPIVVDQFIADQSNLASREEPR